MLPIILFTYYILNNSNFTNVSSTSGLLQGVNNGLAQSAAASGLPIPNPLGIGILFIVFIVLTAIAAFRIDITVAAAFGALVTTTIALFLELPSLALIGPTMVYLFGGLTLFFMFLSLLRGITHPYR